MVRRILAHINGTEPSGWAVMEVGNLLEGLGYELFQLYMGADGDKKSKAGGCVEKSVALV